MSFWFKPDAINNGDLCALAIGTNIDSHRQNIYLGNDNKVRAQSRDGSTNVSAATSSSFVAGSWQHAAGVWSATNARAAFLNGGGKGTETSTVNPAGLNAIAIGRFPSLSPGGYWDGELAEMAMWNVALTDAEVLQLSKGFSPSFIRPSKLVFYAPLIKNEDIDLRGRLKFTMVGTPTVVRHPRIIYPKGSL